MFSSAARGAEEAGGALPPEGLRGWEFLVKAVQGGLARGIWGGGKRDTAADLTAEPSLK